MDHLDVFVSVGNPSNDRQEAFVHAVEERLRSEGITPHTVGRNTFSADAPLKTVTELLDTCVGTVVIALERTYFPTGVQRRNGSQETPLSDVRYPTTWNQIEASMSYSRGLPLLVIVEDGLQNDGLLERGYDWYVLQVAPVPASLTTPEFNGVLVSWKKKLESVDKSASKGSNAALSKPIAELTTRELLGSIRPGHLWSMVTALAAVVTTAFAIGKYFGSHP